MKFTEVSGITSFFLLHDDKLNANARRIKKNLIFESEAIRK
jgi:hypothetical protein